MASVVFSSAFDSAFLAMMPSVMRRNPAQDEPENQEDRAKQDGGCVFGFHGYDVGLTQKCSI
jgi:hypothetical protein